MKINEWKRYAMQTARETYISNKVDFKTKSIIRDKKYYQRYRGTFCNDKRLSWLGRHSNHNVNTLKIVSKYIKQTLTELKRGTDKCQIIVGEFNTLNSSTERIPR